MVELKGIPVNLPDILNPDHAFEIPLQRLQFKVIPALVVRHNRNSIIQLEGIRICCVIDQHHIIQISVDDPQILDIHAFGSRATVLAVETMLDVLVFRVEVVQHHISIAAVTRRKHNYLEVTRQHL